MSKVEYWDEFSNILPEKGLSFFLLKPCYEPSEVKQFQPKFVHLGTVYFKNEKFRRERKKEMGQLEMIKLGLLENFNLQNNLLASTFSKSQ